MARHRKKRKTHVPPNDSAAAPSKTGNAGKRPPKSMVIRMGAGEVGPSVSQLANDFRSVMEPDTASRLKERKANKLKDYSTMAGPLGVTHLFLFSRSRSGNVHLRVALTPRGPTLQFRVEKYALSKDIAKTQKRPRTGAKEFTTAPLLVMNNFVSQQPQQNGEEERDPQKQDPVMKQLESLTTTVFQSMFPPISPQSTPLSSIKRILLLNREIKSEGTYVINLRHYAITTRTAGVSKRVRRFDSSVQQRNEKTGAAIPNLGRLEDVSQYLLDPAAGGYVSGSETELDTDAEVEVLETTAKKVWSKREKAKMNKTADANGEQTQTKRATAERQSHVEKRAVKLVELGPRMRLRLVKVEEGLCEGKIMWNEFVTKTAGEQKELEKKWEVRKKEKEERRRIQKENVEKKKELKKNTKLNSGVGENGVDEEDVSEEELWDSDDLYDDDIDGPSQGGVGLGNGVADEEMDDNEEMHDESSDEEEEVVEGLEEDEDEDEEMDD